MQKTYFKIGRVESHTDYTSNYAKKCVELVRSLELDGYIFRNGRLLISEADVLDLEEEVGLLKSLYTSLHLDNQNIAFNHLDLSEDHYVDGRWGDAISNARNFLEAVLREVASAHAVSKNQTALASSTYGRPVAVREYLEREGLLEAKEVKALAEVYGLLSNVGSHPNMAENDQARLLRQMGLVFSQFVMLRFQGVKNQIVVASQAT